LRQAAALEFAITAGTGGKGTIWLDDLRVTALEPVLPYDLTPVVTASVGTEGAAAVLDGDTLTAWRAPAGTQQLTLDFGRSREYGGAVVVWDPEARARDYDVQVSADGRGWETVRAVRDGVVATGSSFLERSPLPAPSLLNPRPSERLRELDPAAGMGWLPQRAVPEHRRGLTSRPLPQVLRWGAVVLDGGGCQRR
jgi:hypothetical protein